VVVAAAAVVYTRSSRRSRSRSSGGGGSRDFTLNLGYDGDLINKIRLEVEPANLRYYWD
jgi:hypothetical protein